MTLPARIASRVRRRQQPWCERALQALLAAASKTLPLWQLLLLCAGALVSGVGWGMEPARDGAPVQPADPTSLMRYDCIITGGRRAIVNQDLGAQYRMSARCRPFIVEQAEPEPVAPGPQGRAMPFPEAWTKLWPRGPVVRPQGELMWSRYSGLIQDTARRHGLEPRLLMAIAQVESGHQPQARSRAGALGLMQIMPATGARYGVYQSQYLFDPGINVEVAARYLNDLLDQFHGSLELTIAAYNAGEGAVEKHGRRVPPYPETRRYVRAVMGLLKRS
jgi:hypothetical protein